MKEKFRKICCDVLLPLIGLLDRASGHHHLRVPKKRAVLAIFLVSALALAAAMFPFGIIQAKALTLNLAMDTDGYYKIQTADDYLAFVNATLSGSSEGLKVKLADNIDLAGKLFRRPQQTLTASRAFLTGRAIRSQTPLRRYRAQTISRCSPQTKGPLKTLYWKMSISTPPAET